MATETHRKGAVNGSMIKDRQDADAQYYRPALFFPALLLSLFLPHFFHVHANAISPGRTDGADVLCSAGAKYLSTQVPRLAQVGTHSR